MLRLPVICSSVGKVARRVDHGCGWEEARGHVVVGVVDLAAIAHTESYSSYLSLHTPFLSSDIRLPGIIGSTIAYF